MILNQLFNEGANWHTDPEQQSMDATRRGRLGREREPAGSDAIDAQLAANNNARQEYAESGRFWLKQKDTQQHISDSFVGKAAANAAALELLKQRPDLRGNLLITAYGPDETQGVAEGSEDLVQIEYWQQDTMESGRWVKTKPMPRATAEKIVGSFERSEIVDVEQGVAEGDKMARVDKLSKAPKPKNQQEYDAIQKYKADLAKSYQPKKQQSVAEGEKIASKRKDGINAANKRLGVAEGNKYSGTDDTVGFSVNTEKAYTAVMSRFGDVVDHDEDSGIMYVPARLWPQVEMVAFDADGEGATEQDGLDQQGVAEGTTFPGAMSGRDLTKLSRQTASSRKRSPAVTSPHPRSAWHDPTDPRSSKQQKLAYLKSLKSQNVAEAATPASVSKVLRLIQRHKPEWFDNYGIGEVEDTVVDMAEMGQFSGMSAVDALALVGQELESMYGQQGMAEGGYDRDDYYNAQQGGEYGKGLTSVGNGGTGSGTKRDDIFKGQSKRLPADPFRRVTGGIPRADQGRVHRIAQPDEMDEGEKIGNMDADAFDVAMARLKKLAGAGPMKTVYDPTKRVYRNVPVAVQPGDKK